MVGRAGEHHPIQDSHAHEGHPCLGELHTGLLKLKGHVNRLWSLLNEDADSVILGQTWDSAFLTGSQMTVMLPYPGPLGGRAMVVDT